jgi:hypothetical protein
VVEGAEVEDAAASFAVGFTGAVLVVVCGTKRLGIEGIAE